MSIILYSGTPGSYKSYHAVCHAIDDLRFGRNVIANFPMDFKSIKFKQKGLYEYWSNEKITPENLLKFAKEHHEKDFKAQTVVIIDEASTMFNARDFGRADRLKWIYFLANHRHFNFDFILVTQNDQMLDKQIRGLIEQEIRHRAISNYNFFTFLFSRLVKGLYATVEYWYPCRMRNGGNFHKFNKRKADCYDTMALFIDTPYTEAMETSKVAKATTKSAVKTVEEQLKPQHKHYVRGWSDEQTASNDTQRTQDETATVLDGNIMYDNNTGVSVINSDSKS